MNRIKAFSLGLALAISVGALAQDSVTPSRLRLQSLGVNNVAPARGQIVVTADTAATTPIRANGNGTNDVEILVNSPAGGDAYVRTTAISATNWSAGVRRSDSAYVIANSIGVGTPRLTVDTSGNTTAAGTLTVSGATATVNGSAVCTAANGQCPQSIPTPSTYTGVSSSTVGPLTFNSGNFTTTVTGCTVGTGPFVVWSRRGWHVNIQFSKFSCTSNSGLFRLCGFPTELRPGANSNMRLVPGGNNGAQSFEIEMYMSSSGCLEGSYQGTTWTASGTKWYGSATGGTSFGFDYSLAW